MKVSVREMAISLAIVFATTALATVGWAQQPASGGTGAAPASPKASSVPKPATENSAPVPPDKVVLKVGDQQVTVGDLDFVLHTLNDQDQKAVEAQGRRAIGEQYALTLLLSQRGARDHLDASPDFRRQEAWERNQRLAQAEYEQMAKGTTVTPEEVSQYYAQHSKDFEQIEVRQVGIRKKPQDAKADVPGLTPTEAAARVDAIRKALQAGTDIKKVAADFAVPNAVFIDPNPKRLQKGQLNPDLEKKLFTLKDGELSEAVDNPQSIVFVQAVKHVQPELKEVQSGIENTIRQQKLKAQVDGLRNEVKVWMDEDYFRAPSASAASTPASPQASTASPSPKQ